MEYTFGVINSVEYMRIKGYDKESELIGTNSITINHPDSIVTHRFTIERLLKKNDEYIWYEISDHSMYIDRTPALEAENKKLRAMIDYISMMTDIELELEDEHNEQRVY